MKNVPLLNNNLTDGWLKYEGKLLPYQFFYSSYPCSLGANKTMSSGSCVVTGYLPKKYYGHNTLKRCQQYLSQWACIQIQLISKLNRSGRPCNYGAGPHAAYFCNPLVYQVLMICRSFVPIWPRYGGYRVCIIGFYCWGHIKLGSKIHIPEFSRW